MGGLVELFLIGGLLLWLIWYLFFRSLLWAAEPLIEYFESREVERFLIEDIDKNKFDDSDLESIPKSKVKVTLKDFNKPIHLSKTLLQKAQKQPQKLGNTNLWIYKDHIFSSKPVTEKTESEPNKPNPKRKHHYIPVFYLSGFTNDNRCIWVYDKETGNVFESKPEGIAYEKHYFSFIAPNGTRDSETIENLIMSLEAECSKVVRRILSCELLNEDEGITFAYFVALMMLRAPNFRRNIESATSELMKKISVFIASHKEGFESMIAKYERDTGNKIGIPSEELREWLLNPDKNYTIKTDPQYSLALALDFLKDFPKVFFGMKWAFLKATSDYKFLTGDNPLYYFDPTHNPRSFYGVGLFNKNIEVTLPLSKDMCAFGSWKHREGYIQAKNQWIKNINRRTAIAALRFVFASERSETLKEFIMKYKGSAPKMRVG